MFRVENVTMNHSLSNEECRLKTCYTTTLKIQAHYNLIVDICAQIMTIYSLYQGQ